MNHNLSIVPSNYPSCKGVPARESHTGTRLVSPAAGCKKKKEASTTGPQTTQLSTVKHTIVIYINSIESVLASRGTLKHPKRGEIVTYPFHIWMIFISCIINKGHEPNSARLESEDSGLEHVPITQEEHQSLTLIV